MGLSFHTESCKSRGNSGLDASGTSNPGGTGRTAQSGDDPGRWPKFQVLYLLDRDHHMQRQRTVREHGWLKGAKVL